MKRSYLVWFGLLVAATQACSVGIAAGHHTVGPPDRAHAGAGARSGAESEQERGPETFEALEQLAGNASISQRWVGKASYYSDRLVGNRMASGATYESGRPYAAHRTLPFGSLIRVVRLSTGASVVLRVKDRGPFGDRQRIVDVSRAAAERLDLMRAGVADVRVELLSVSP